MAELKTSKNIKKKYYDKEEGIMYKRDVESYEEELKQGAIKDIKLYRQGTIGMPKTIQDYIKWKFNLTEEDLK